MATLLAQQAKAKAVHKDWGLLCCTAEEMSPWLNAWLRYRADHHENGALKRHHFCDEAWRPWCAGKIKEQLCIVYNERHKP